MSVQTRQVRSDRSSVWLSTHLEHSTCTRGRGCSPTQINRCQVSLYPFRFWTLCHSIFSSWYTTWNTGFCSTYRPLICTYESPQNWVFDYKESTRLNTLTSSIQKHLLSHIHYQGNYRDVLDITKFNDQFLNIFFVSLQSSLLSVHCTLRMIRFLRQFQLPLIDFLHFYL